MNFKGGIGEACSSPIAGNSAHVCATVGRVEVVSVGLSDVVLVQRISGPAVDGKEGVAGSAEARVECDGPEVALLLIDVLLLLDSSYRALPVSQPFPATTSVESLVHVTLYSPAAPLVYVAPVLLSM